MLRLIEHNFVYCNGPGTSAPGLTASVRKVGEEMIIDRGLLILADKGLCCIDEFDKINIGARDPIHNSMEMGEVSINKADLNIKFNSSCSILAASNFSFGSFNFNKSIEENLNLDAALYSRFDLTFCLIQEGGYTEDLALGKKILKNHTNTESEGESENNFVNLDFLRKYVKIAKKIQPSIPPVCIQLTICKKK